jgi:hypothetical protein
MSEPSLFSKLKGKLHIHSTAKEDREPSPVPSFDPPSQVQVNTRQTELPQDASVHNQTSLLPVPVLGQTAAISTPVQRPTEALGTVRNGTKASQVPDTSTTETPPTKTNSEIRMSPIYELWNEAYEELRVKEESLIKEYETRLRGSVQGLVASTTGSIGREELMKTIVDKKLGEYQNGKLKIKAFGGEVAVKDMIKPVVGIVKWADTYISSAISANPIASVAWAGVTVFLPVSVVVSMSQDLKSRANSLAATQPIGTGSFVD